MRYGRRALTRRPRAANDAGEGNAMALYEFEGRRPVVGRTSFVHPEATLIGAVTIGCRCF